MAPQLPRQQFSVSSTFQPPAQAAHRARPPCCAMASLLPLALVGVAGAVAAAQLPWLADAIHAGVALVSELAARDEAFAVLGAVTFLGLLFLVGGNPAAVRAHCPSHADAPAHALPPHTDPTAHHSHRHRGFHAWCVPLLQAPWEWGGNCTTGQHALLAAAALHAALCPPQHVRRRRHPAMTSQCRTRGAQGTSSAGTPPLARSWGRCR